MINRLWRWFFTPRYSYDRVNMQRAQGLLLVNTLFMVLTVFRLVNELRDPVLISLNLLNIAASLVVHMLVQRGNFPFAAGIFIISLSVNSLSTNLVVQGLHQSRTLFLLLPPIAAGALLSDRRYIVAVSGLMIALSLIVVTEQSRLVNTVVTIPAYTATTDLFNLLTGLGLLTVFSTLLVAPLRQMLARTQNNADVLHRITEFGVSVLDRVETLEAACSETILFLRTKLNYPFAQVFIVGGKGVLNQRIRTGLSAEFTTRDDITVGDLSAINQTLVDNAPVMVSRNDPLTRIAHFLPSTTYGLCLPVSDQEGVVGVLDIQSASAPFTPEDTDALQAVAAYLGAAIADIRLIEALRNNIRQQEEVSEKLRERLHEMQQFTTSTVSASWDAYLRQRGHSSFGVDMKGSSFMNATEIPENLLPVLKNGALLVQNQDNLKIVNIPISLHGEVVGAMSFTIPKDRVLTERQIDTAQIVANRLALAIENKRLVEQTRAQAARERKANETANVLLSATDVDAVVNLAVQTFNEALGAINTRIHLQPAALAETERSNEPA